MLERLSPQPAAPDPGIERRSVDDAGPMLEALGSGTARSIVAELADGPATTSEIADRIDGSVQNVGYHLSNLEEAGLVTAVGTRYSEKGREMTVYARDVAALVIDGDDGGRT